MGGGRQESSNGVAKDPIHKIFSALKTTSVQSYNKVYRYQVVSSGFQSRFFFLKKLKVMAHHT